MRLIDAQQLRKMRTFEERERRHIHGDAGAKYSQGKVLYVAKDGMMGALTTAEAKDNLLVEVYET